MYAKVIPAIRLPKSFGEYDYAVPPQYRAHVRRGSWIIVPWRGRPVDALVIGISDRPSVDPKKVKDILGFGAIQPLSADLTVLPMLIAENCFVSPTTAVKAFLPTTPKTKVIKELDEDPTNEQAAPATGNEERLIVYRSPREKSTWLLKLIGQTKGDVVVITPHKDEVEPLSKMLTEQQGLPVVPLHGAMTAPAVRRTWHQLLAAPRSIVVGTRLAAFAPVRRASLFVILEADSADLRQYDQSPRYDSRQVVRWRAAVNGATVALLSHAPRLEEYTRVTAGLATLKAEKAENNTILVDIAGNPRGPNQPLSPVVMNRLEDSLRNGQKVLIFHNRLGAAGALFCRDCGRVFRCPACKVVATILESSLRCGRCGLEGPLPAQCPDCSGLNLGRAGLGTETMAQALRDHFPDNTIASYDSAQTPEERQVALATADILIGTRLLVHDAAESGPSDCWGAVVATDTDELLAHPGFRVTEDAWRTVRLLADIAATAGSELLLQTTDPESPKIRRLLQGLTDFMKAEIADRQLVGYPPAGELITITVRAYDAAQAEQAASALRKRLEDTVGGLSLAGPLRHSRPYRDGQWRSVLAIKTPQVQPPLAELLKTLPKEYIIDRNPESVG